MTGSVSSEWAECVDEYSGWRLSWLPDVGLSHAQACAGVELAELVAAPGGLVDTARAQACADAVNVSLAQAISLLHQRRIWRRSP
ncbi:hypothetical protein ACWDSJ_03140 [Nocardia sp. NPDC003482]